MTTESTQDHHAGVSPLLGAAVVCGVLLVIVGLSGLLVAGAAGLVGALAGGSLALVVLVTSTTVVNTIAGAMPSASLLFALLTFLLQVMLLAVVALAIRQAGLAEATFSAGWFVGGIIATTLSWIAAHTWFYTRLRIPAFDLHKSHRAGGEA